MGEAAYAHIPHFDAFYSKEFHAAKAFTTPTPKAAEAVALAKEKAGTVVLATNPFFPRVAVDARLSWTGITQEAFDRITLRLEAERAQKAEVKLFKTLQEERFYTVEEKMDLLTETLRRVPRITFDSLFTDVHSRGEVVAIFLSVLEAVRFGFVDVFRENEDTLWLSLVKE
jgi:chromatin segregation and condensation protein Rec8/ScpA/Scc1 (kleisin family)